MLFKYAIEIRNRLLLVLLSWSLCAIVSYYYKETLLFLSLKTLIDNGIKHEVYFIATNVTEILLTYVKLSYLTANLASFVIAMYHLLIFLSPGLYLYEQTKLKNIVIKSVVSSSLALILVNKHIIAFCWKFFLSFQNPSDHKSVSLYFEGKICEYIEFYILVCFICVIISQLTVCWLFYLDSVKNKIEFVRSYRKLFYVGFLISATMVTPPDVLSQLLVVSILLVIYELTVTVTLFKTFSNSVTN